MPTCPIIAGSVTYKRYIHTVIHTLYSFHNQLKTTYLNGKVNCRVDFLIHHFLQYQKDAFFHYKMNWLLPPALQKKEKQEMNHHQRGLMIPAASEDLYMTNMY